MRLVHTFTDEKQGRIFSSFLTSQGIENLLEVSSSTDWGNEKYGDISHMIWVMEEDDVDTTMEWLEKFQEDPDAPEFSQIQPKKSLEPPTRKPSGWRRFSFKKGPPQGPPQPLGPVTSYVLVLCITIFLFTLFTSPSVTTIPKTVPLTPLYSSPIKKQLMYDYPESFLIIDKLIKAYGREKVLNPQELPKEGKALLIQAKTLPKWEGFYDQIVARSKNTHKSWDLSAPMFERIRDGEVWRLLTPCFLHNDLLHILFNMLWLIIIGKQIERRVGMMRYLLFILITGVFSSTCQYLMSGPNFIGFSGVLCGMILFVWTRQKLAPWEGYHLEGATMGFITVFVLAMFLLQFVSFLTEVYWDTVFIPIIANTAHLTGAASGWALARSKLFAVK